MKRQLWAIILVAGTVGFSGCSAFRQSVSTVDVNNTQPMGASYDYSDLKTWAGTMADRILNEFVTKTGKDPIYVIMEVDNRTTRLIDTKALTDTIRQALINKGSLRFVNATQRDNLLKEKGYQQAAATPETRVAMGRELGARYLLSGSLVEITKSTGRQVRLSKQEEIFYQLTLEITDIETGLVAWTAQEERARQVSKPLIGW